MFLAPPVKKAKQESSSEDDSSEDETPATAKPVKKSKYLVIKVTDFNYLHLLNLIKYIYNILAINKPSVAQDVEESDEESDDENELPKTSLVYIIYNHYIYSI